ncbi:MAG TPA: hypothetical protein VMZ28_24910 [Kofleriaceae bacterium]|nr:hypothetical protein [Kofleriaceae bacterium]
MRRALLLIVLVGCQEAGPATSEADPSKLKQRVFEPSPGLVRAVPPHGIQATGVGPYTLGSELREILAMLPHGPRVELLEIEDVVGYSVVRAEGDRLLIGVGSSGRVSFVSVLQPDIAKTESGLEVGASVDDLTAKVGPETPPAGVRDPRIVELDRLPNARVVVDQGRVAAIVIGPGGAGAPAAPTADAPKPDAGVAAEPPHDEPDAGTCARAAELLAQAPLGAAAPTTRVQAPFFGCFTGGSPEVALVGKDEIAIYGGEPDRLRRVGGESLAGLLFAGAVDLDGDGRQEIVAASERRTGDALSIRLHVLRGEAGRLQTVVSDEVYRMTSDTAAWVGAKLKDVDFLLRADPRHGGLEVRGLYVHRVGGAVQTVAPLSPRKVAVRGRKRPATTTPATPAATDPGSESAAGGRTPAAAAPDAGHPPPRAAKPPP